MSLVYPVSTKACTQNVATDREPWVSSVTGAGNGVSVTLHFAVIVTVSFEWKQLDISKRLHTTNKNSVLHKKIVE